MADTSGKPNRIRRRVVRLVIAISGLCTLLVAMFPAWLSSSYANSYLYNEVYHSSNGIAFSRTDETDASRTSAAFLGVFFKLVIPMRLCR